MISKAQLRYAQEVLGVRLETVPRALTRSPLVVWARPKTAEQQELLEKILRSAGLGLEWLGTEPATHTIDFTGKHTPGRHANEHGVLWAMHPLDRMLGPDPDVQTCKREVWNWLQQLKKECRL